MVKEGMPNSVYNKIELKVTEEHAKEIEEQVAPSGKLDFNTLIEVPLHYIRITSREEMDLSGETNEKTNEDLIFLIQEDQKDFPHPQEWKIENWGTKHNCYDSKISYSDGILSISFTTAWSVPYPIIVAFGNKFQIPFKLKYFEELEQFWGIEEYESSKHVEGIYRSSKVLSKQDDYEFLYKELMG